MANACCMASKPVGMVISGADHIVVAAQEAADQLAGERELGGGRGGKVGDKIITIAKAACARRDDFDAGNDGLGVAERTSAGEFRKRGHHANEEGRAIRDAWGEASQAGSVGHRLIY